MALVNRANVIPMIPNPISATEGLVKAVETFVLERSFQDVADLVHEIHQLKRDTKEKDQELQALSAKIGEKDRERSNCLKTFREEAARQDRSIAERDERVRSLERDVKNMQELVKGHKDAETKLKRQEAEARELLKTEKSQHKNTQDSKSELADELLAKSGEILDLKIKLEKAKEVTQRTKAALDLCEQNNKELDEDLRVADDELLELKGYAVELVREDLDTTVSRLKDLWGPAIQLVQNYFSQDVSEHVTQHNYAWTAIERFNTRVPPIPRSNSRAAKSMRVSAILAILATLIDQSIFQSTYLMDDATELNQLLLNEAGTCSAKESFLRAMLLATRADEQASIASKRIKHVVKELGDCVQDLLPVQQRASFSSELQVIVSKLQDTWHHTNCLERKVEPTFNAGVRGLEWEPICPDAPPQKREGNENESTAGGKQDQVFLVLCPGMYAVDEEGIQQILPGIVLMTSQTEEAQQEVQDSPSWPPPGRAPTNRVGQNRSRRRDSILEGLYIQPANQGLQHFLSSAHL